MIESKLISSIEKVMPHTEPSVLECGRSMFVNERYNFQLAFCYRGEGRMLMCNQIKIEGALAPYITVRNVCLVPVTMLPPTMDDYYISHETGVFPDLLKPFDNVGLVLPKNQWRAVWVTIYAPNGIPAGNYETKFFLISEKGETLTQCTHKLEVIGVKTPEHGLRLTNWMHYDCISQQHGVKLFSRAFYRVFEGYLKSYVEGGYNMLMTPLFTPPLDTKIGTERQTAQLVRVRKDETGYAFDFTELKRFIRFIRKRGIKYIEFSPLFTQWGGAACPKIMANVNGEEKRVFGWETPSGSVEYTQFLAAFLPALGKVIDELKLREYCYLHLTDEPSLENIDVYENCRKMVKQYIGDIPVMDALGDPEFKERGLVDIPVTGIKYYDKFEGQDPSKMFVYNCCTAFDSYHTNRFITMPSQRTRILGFQLYETGVQGYLHWGYNFYRSAYSLEKIDPYADTDAHSTFPSGDAFIVYPAKNGVNGSIRYEVVKEGFQDYDALKLLEEYVGREKVLTLLREQGVKGYTEYPRDGEWHLQFREKINQMIKAYSR